MPVILGPGMKRKSIAQLRVTEEEAALLRHVSAAVGVPLAIYVRDAALDKARAEIMRSARHAVE